MSFLRQIEKAKGPAVATDMSNRVLAWNAAAEELFAFEDHKRVTGRRFFHLIDARDSFGNSLPEVDVAFLAMTQRGEPVHGFELTAVDADSERIRLSVIPVVLLAEEEEDTKIIYFIRPLLRRRRADEAIERLLASPTTSLESLGFEVNGNTFNLTERQLETLRFMAEGLSNAEIARVLNISINTVRTHVHDVLDRLDVRSRVEAVARAYREGLL